MRYIEQTVDFNCVMLLLYKKLLEKCRLNADNTIMLSYSRTAADLPGFPKKIARRAFCERRELTFTFAIYDVVRPSVCLSSVVCLLSVVC